MGTSATTLTPHLRYARWIAWMAAALYGCAAGPDYVRPPVATPAAYKEAQGWKQAAPRDDKPRGDWWEVFNDPELNALVTQVAISNQTIKAAEAQVRSAESVHGLYTLIEQYPDADLLLLVGTDFRPAERDRDLRK